MLTFYDFWLVYPPRKGANPKAAARTKWDTAIKNGVEPEVIINAAKAYRDEVIAEGNMGTPFVSHARTWLNQKRYEDYEPDPGSKERDARIDADMLRRGYQWLDGKWQKVTPVTAPQASVMEPPEEFI